jgi:transposase
LRLEADGRSFVPFRIGGGNMPGEERNRALTTLWALQGFEVGYVEVRDAPTKRDPRRRIKVVGLVDCRGHHKCSCGKKHDLGVFQEPEPKLFRDCSVGDFETHVEITPWRVACCGGTRIEVFPWEAPGGHRMTRRFFERLAALCTRMPVNKVAEMAKLSWDTVARIDKTAIGFALGDNSPPFDEPLRFVGVDEVSRTGGRCYFTIVSNLASGRVVWIGDGSGGSVLNGFFDAIGTKACNAIKVVVSDLAPGYVRAITKRTPKAVHILDRFHIVKWLNEAVDNLRRQLFGGAPSDDVGRALKGKKWLLLKARENLSTEQRTLVDGLMRVNRKIYRTYPLKERLRGILHYPWRYLNVLRSRLSEWCHAAICSRIPGFKKIGYRLREHAERVVAAFKEDVKMGLVESINGKIGQLRREARGYRDMEYFKSKIFQRCSLPSNPWSEITL